MALDDSIVRSFKVAKIFCDKDKINNIDFSANGEFLITCSEGDRIVMYDCEKGMQLQRITSIKYGVDLIHFTHAKNTVIHSSTKVNDNIRCLSLEDNKFLRYFQGHTNKVVAICTSPSDETFVSASLDKTLRLWDLRSPIAYGVIHMPPGRTVAAYEPEGVIFAAGCCSEFVKLYDLRFFNKGPFATFKFAQEKECFWTGLKFSQDGNSILISTSGLTIRLIDALQGKPLQSFTRHHNNNGIPIEASFSPDSQFVFSGSIDGSVHVWKAETGYEVCVLETDNHGPVRSVQFNPKFMMMASASTSTSFWIPTLNDSVN